MILTDREIELACQLIFETTLGTPEKGYTGIFPGQTAGHT